MSLEIQPIMNSAVEEIFGFKTCCGMRAFDLNLEIRITNRKDRPVYVQSLFDCMDAEASYRVDTLMPHGTRRIAPGETIAFYCTMDENRWTKAKRIVFYDTEGNPYAVNRC
jgi:urease beta subunit